MRISQQALDVIKNDSRTINLIAAEFRCAEITVRRWIEKNEPYSDLTKKDSLEIISRETGMTQDEILTQEPAQA